MGSDQLTALLANAGGQFDAVDLGLADEAGPPASYPLAAALVPPEAGDVGEYVPQPLPPDSVVDPTVLQLAARG